MATLRHKLFGEAEIIQKEGNRLTIQYKKSGKKTEIQLPEALTYGLFVLNDELQREVDEMLAAAKEAARIEREAKELRRAKEEAQTAKAPAHKTGRTSQTPAMIKMKNTVEQDFENYLIASGYSVETPSGAPSTVNSYITAVNSILEDEGLTWNSLPSRIASIVPIYDEGGVKEETGSKSNYTYLNALRRFQDFVNNSAP